MKDIAPPWSKGRMNFDERPIFVCWEVTKACGLACKHCRAEAINSKLPGELDLQQGIRLLDQVAEFGEPYPAILFTGGDPLMRRDLLSLVSHAANRGIYTAVAASVTDLLDEEMISKLAGMGIGVLSISIDGSAPEFHDGLRGVPGTFERSVAALEKCRDAGLKVQINTTVMESNLGQLPEIFNLALEYDAVAWEVFFLIRTGRGLRLDAPSPTDTEEVMKFLSLASKYGIAVRTSEGPQYRRVRLQEKEGSLKGKSLSRSLSERLIALAGPPRGESSYRASSTRDGKGVMFITHDGVITPSGFLPIEAGRFPDQNIVDVYKNSILFRDLRDSSKLKGKCGRCEFRNVCGGSRSRAYAEYGDPLSQDPLCIYDPAS